MTFNSRPTGARPSPLLVAFREECEALTDADAERLTMYPADWIRVATSDYWSEPADGMLEHGVKVLRRLLDREMTGSSVQEPEHTDGSLR